MKNTLKQPAHSQEHITPADFVKTMLREGISVAARKEAPREIIGSARYIAPEIADNVWQQMEMPDALLRSAGSCYSNVGICEVAMQMSASSRHGKMLS